MATVLTAEDAEKESIANPDSWVLLTGGQTDWLGDRDEVFFRLGQYLGTRLNAYGTKIDSGHVYRGGKIVGWGEIDVDGLIHFKGTQAG